MDVLGQQAFLFDLDGVITPTAEVHMRAWSDMFNAFLRGRGVGEAYIEEDYFAHVDGKPRYDGVRDFLASRGIELPEGDPDDDPSAETVAGLGNRKNAEFNAIIERDGIQPYPGSVRLVEHLEAADKRLAVVSSSRNARPVLEAAGLIQHFPVIVDGVVARAEGLPGKPAPDTFQFAADRLGVPYEDCVVLEDAVSGVQAGAAGGFAVVVGVDRGAGAESLRQHGADIVVNDLEELL